MIQILLKSLILLLVGSCFFSCSSEKMQLTIEQDKLVSILSDLHVAEEMLGKFRQVEKDSVRRIFLSDIADIHQVDTTVIFRNIEILQKDPKLALGVYNEVYEKLTEYAEIDKPKRTKKEEPVAKEKSKVASDSIPLTTKIKQNGPK